MIGGNAIGDHALVGAGSVVTRPVADHELVTGNPARHRGWVCDCGRVVNHDDARPAVLTCARCAGAES